MKRLQSALLGAILLISSCEKAEGEMGEKLNPVSSDDQQVDLGDDSYDYGDQVRARGNSLYIMDEDIKFHVVIDKSLHPFILDYLENTDRSHSFFYSLDNQLNEFRFLTKESNVTDSNDYGSYYLTPDFYNAVNDTNIPLGKVNRNFIDPDFVLYAESETHLKKLINKEKYKNIKDKKTLEFLKWTQKQSVERKHYRGDESRDFVKSIIFYKQDFSDEVKRMRVYREKRLYKDLLIRTKKSASLESFETIVFDLSGTPNLYVKMERTVDMASLESGFFVEVVNPINGELIFTDSATSSLLSGASTINYSQAEQTLSLFCDSATINISGKEIMVGPYEKQSLLGWNSHPKTIRETLSGAYLLNGLAYMVYGGHLNDIVSENYEYKNIISGTFSECFNDDFLNTVSSYGVRVTNLSVSYVVNKELCEELSIPQTMKDRKEMMWVLAAGNDGGYITEENNYYCPSGRVTGERNTIVVNTDKSLYSNTGPDFVDITTNDESTSLAAVRVTNLFEKIARKYPDLTNEQIRMAILISSDKNSYRSTRSQGDLNEDKAIEAARLINEEYLYGLELYSELNKENCGWRSSYGCKRKMKREFERFEKYDF